MRTDGEFSQVHDLLADLSLHTVCRSAKCPNLPECWGRGTATLMLLGNICTRNCRFCAIPSGRPEPPDPGEPARVAEAARRLNLRYLVLTCVTRDDLEDGGASVFAETIRTVKAACPGISVEVLTSDFQGKPASIDRVLDAEPDVFNHNLETVRRLQPMIRSRALYDRSLGVLKQAAGHPAAPAVKSGLMVGLGETDEEIFRAMEDLLVAGCRLLTLGQYLQPTRIHARVERFVTPDEFAAFAEKARGLGFAGVAAGPMVRSSYRAEELLRSVGGDRVAAAP